MPFDDKNAAPEALRPAAAEAPPRPAQPRRRRALRVLLLVVVPLMALAAGLAVYLQGGRYITTDNAAVAAQKVLVAPEVAGKIVSISVVEGQALKAGDLVFAIDPEPYRLAMERTEAQLADVANQFAGLKATLASLKDQLAVAQETVALRQSEVDRVAKLVKSALKAPATLEDQRIMLTSAQAGLAALEQQRDVTLAKLGNRADLPIEAFPPHGEAKAAVEQAQRNLEATTLRAPIAGIATQVSNIQLGRFIAAGTPVFAIVASEGLWVDANPKETDLTYLKEGQPVTVAIDAFPDRQWLGRVGSISPGTGAQFSILPPQNASGNWVKVVQRVPVRIELAPGQDTAGLRAGLSVSVAIDTGRQRTLAGLIGGSAMARVVTR